MRELENAVEHAIICAVGNIILPESLPQDIRNFTGTPIDAGSGNGAATADETMAIERAEIEKALADANGNKSMAARYLGVDRTTLWRRMRRLNISESDLAGGSA